MNNFTEQIAELADLEANATPGPWSISDGHGGPSIVDSNGVFVAETSGDTEDSLICALRNKSLPLLKEIQGALLEEQHERQIWETSAKANETIIDSQNEQISFLMGANSAFVQEIESLHAENKQLKDAIAQAELFIGLIESHGLEYALSKVVKA